MSTTPEITGRARGGGNGRPVAVIIRPAALGSWRSGKKMALRFSPYRASNHFGVQLVQIRSSVLPFGPSRITFTLAVQRFEEPQHPCRVESQSRRGSGRADMGVEQSDAAQVWIPHRLRWRAGHAVIHRQPGSRSSGRAYRSSGKACSGDSHQSHAQGRSITVSAWPEQLAAAPHRARAERTETAGWLSRGHESAETCLRPGGSRTLRQLAGRSVADRHRS
jgi:hypothetical protein